MSNLAGGFTWVTNTNQPPPQPSRAYPMYRELVLNGSGVGMWTTTYHLVGEATMSVVYDIEAYGSIAVEYSSLNVPGLVGPRFLLPT